MDLQINKLIWQMRIHDCMLRWYGFTYSSSVAISLTLQKKLLQAKVRTKFQYYFFVGNVRQRSLF